MTVDVEDRVRDALHQQAVEIEVRGPRPEGVFERVRQRRNRRRATRAAVAIVAVAVIGFGVASRESGTNVRTGHAASEPSGAALGHPAMVTLPGWKVHYIAVVDSYSEYQFTNGSQSLQVSFYPLASREGNSTNPTEVTIRGAHGVTTDEGAPRYRVDWNEQGQTWEADGEPFSGIDEFLGVLEQVQVIDEATWKASLPDGIGASILANNDRGITWYDNKGISCFGPQESMPCR